MASKEHKNPELGRCQCPNCDDGEMVIRSRAVGQGGRSTKLYGYCAGCRSMAQKNSDQDWLKKAVKGEKAPETPAAEDSAMFEGFNPAEVAPDRAEVEPVQTKETDDTPTENPTRTENGQFSVGKVLGCAFLSVLALAGLGKLASL